MHRDAILRRLGEIAEPGSKGISDDRKHILCATHGALFRIDDGHCLHGPCLGRSLSRVAIRLEGDSILLVD